MSHMKSIRGFFSVLVLALVLALSVFGSTAPVFAQQAPQIVVEGANVDPSTLKPYFSGTDPASISARRRRL